MHNCKRTRTGLIELALGELPAEAQKYLLIELSDCEACREEYYSLRSTMRVTDQALQSALPDENFWAGYHDRLTQRLAHEQAQLAESAPPVRWGPTISRLATYSVRLPLPIAAALALLFAGAIFFALNARAQTGNQSRNQINNQVDNRSANESTVVEISTISVPVVQEKVVTRIVYVDRARARRAPATNLFALAPAVTTESQTAGTTALSLIDFKPTDHVKLKVMKGSYRDEK